MEKTTLAALPKGEYFKFSDKPNAKVYEKLSGKNTKTSRYGWVEDHCDEQFTKNGKRVVYINFEF